MNKKNKFEFKKNDLVKFKYISKKNKFEINN